VLVACCDVAGLAVDPPIFVLIPQVVALRELKVCTFDKTENMSNPTKKRKANDAAPHDGGGGFLSSCLGYFSGRCDEITPTAQPTCGGDLTQMDRIENIVTRIEERQLATVSLSMSTTDSIFISVVTCSLPTSTVQ
jgi:hypothetical protein